MRKILDFAVLAVIVLFVLYCVYIAGTMIHLNSCFETVFKTELCADRDYVSEATGNVVIKAGTTCEVRIYLIKAGYDVSSRQCFNFLKLRGAKMFGSYLGNKEFVDFVTKNYKIQRLLLFDEGEGYVPNFKLTSKHGDWGFGEDDFMVSCENRCGANPYGEYSTSGTFQNVVMGTPHWPKGTAILCIVEK